jgi:protein PhnA
MNNFSSELTERCGGSCELCKTKTDLSTFVVSPKTGHHIDEQIALCDTCLDQYLSPNTANSNHWRCLNDSIWSTVPAIQVFSYRMLQQLSSQKWAADLLEMMYLDDDTREWAENVYANTVHKDSNGQTLQSGDSVVIIKDLEVKGANFTAKRGTVVKRINLVEENAEQIEGKVNDQHIVILTKFVRKSV